MTRPIINDNGLNREMTLEEVAIYETWIAEKQEEDAQNAAADATKVALREAALAKLGLTAEEVRALFG